MAFGIKTEDTWQEKLWKRVPLRVRRLLSLLFALYVVGTLSFIAYDLIVRYPRAALVQNQLESAIREIPAPGAATQVRYSATHKGSHALVDAAYDLPWSLEQLQQHYGRILETKGWRFIGVQVVRNWGREIGLREATWSQPPFRATLFYCRTQRVAYGCDYSFSLSWGLH